MASAAAASPRSIAVSLGSPPPWLACTLLCLVAATQERLDYQQQSGAVVELLPELDLDEGEEEQQEQQQLGSSFSEAAADHHQGGDGGGDSGGAVAMWLQLEAETAGDLDAAAAGDVAAAAAAGDYDDEQQGLSSEQQQVQQQGGQHAVRWRSGPASMPVQDIQQDVDDVSL